MLGTSIVCLSTSPSCETLVGKVRCGGQGREEENIASLGKVLSGRVVLRIWRCDWTLPVQPLLTFTPIFVRSWEGAKVRVLPCCGVSRCPGL